MKLLSSLLPYLSSTSIWRHVAGQECKCTPNSDCWPSEAEWYSLNLTLSGALIRGVPPGSVCYPEHSNYNPETCVFVASQWFNSTWHAENPVSIDYPIWTDDSCNPIWPNGTSVTGDVTAGSKGCSMGAYPAYVVNATTPQQIGAALTWAGRNNVRVIVKNTGHSYLGRSIGYGSLSIWTHHFRGLEYIQDFKPTSCPINGTVAAVRVAAGTPAGAAQAALAKHGVITVTGSNPDVGVVGWLTGGGHGPLSRTYGMGADNLLEATIVTPDGSILLANPCNNADMFFAIRGGGGGTYGVITELVVKAFPTPKTTAHTFQVTSLSPNTSTEYWDLVGFLHADMKRLHEGGMQGYYFLAGAPYVPTLSFQWKFYLYNKPNGAVEGLMAPIEEYLKERAHLFAYQSTIAQADTYLDIYDGGPTNEQVATGGTAYGSWLLSPASLTDPNVTANVFAEIGAKTDPLKRNAHMTNPLLMGHMIGHPDPPTYYPEHISMNPAWRNTLTHLIVHSGWPDGSPRNLIDTVYQDITHKTEALRKLSPDTGAYFNEADSYEPEWQQAFFGKNYDRLKSIKERFDPDNVLWCRRCVGSEALEEQSDGRLCRSGYGKKTEYSPQDEL